MSIAAASSLIAPVARSSAPGVSRETAAPQHGAGSFESILGGQLAPVAAQSSPGHAPAGGSAEGSAFFVSQPSTSSPSTAKSSAAGAAKAPVAAQASNSQKPSEMSGEREELAASASENFEEHASIVHDAAQPVRSPGAPAPRNNEKSKSAAKPEPGKSSASGAPSAQAGAQSGPAAMAKIASGTRNPSRDAQPGTSISSRAHDSHKVALAPQSPPAPQQKSAAAPIASSSSTSIAPRESSSPGVARTAPVPFAHEAQSDDSLHLALMPQAAHMRMDVNGSDLALHLRLQGGVAHVTVSGDAAPLVDARSSDLRSALSAQGLTLGSVEQVQRAQASGDAAGQQLAQQDQQRDPQAEHERDQRDADRVQAAPGKAQRDSRAFTISRSTAQAARAASTRKESP